MESGKPLSDDVVSKANSTVTGERPRTPMQMEEEPRSKILGELLKLYWEKGRDKFLEKFFGEKGDGDLLQSVKEFVHDQDIDKYQEVDTYDSRVRLCLEEIFKLANRDRKDRRGAKNFAKTVMNKTRNFVDPDTGNKITIRSRKTKIKKGP